jgi:hypothetical protein
LHWKTKKKSTKEENATRDVNKRERERERKRKRADRRDQSEHGGREVRDR